ncbi:MAG: hypothetical protein WCE30_08275 [Mycobacterium sp.]
MKTREYLGGAYAPPRTRKNIQRSRLIAGAVLVAVIAAVAAAVLLFWHTPPPDRSGQGAAAVHRLMSAPVITAAGTVRTKDGVQHPFTVDVNTHTGDALGQWASGNGHGVTYSVSRRALFAQVNPGVWASIGINSNFQGWALVPDSLFGQSPVVLDPSTLAAAVDGGPTSYVGNEYTYAGGTTVRLRDGDVESVTFKGTDYTLTLHNDDTASKRIADSAKDAAAARVATVNDTPAGFTVTLPAGAPDPQQQVTPPVAPPPAAPPSPGPTP